ncbi:uncharacterized protein V1518DRAFT_418442 [Limtongia smithiae]|uniref:uncharacterized protein n=1 Tax=Limtongia smithiae TaxID=1125753 RepID=UPI0034CE0667
MLTPVPTAVPVYRTDDPHSFAYISARERWVTIVAGCVRDMQAEGAAATTDDAAKDAEECVARLEKLLEELTADAALVPLENDGDAEDLDVGDYNAQLLAYNDAAKSNGTPVMSYLCGPWLYVECYLYRKIWSCTRVSKHFAAYDIYRAQKRAAFAQSQRAVAELASHYATLAPALRAGEVATEQIAELFREFVDIALWGNATDLSLLTNLKAGDLANLQGAQARKQSEANVLVNDVAKAWEALTAGKGGARVDMVLDNAGFEFYTDAVFALFLLDAGLASTIVLHTKRMPWFVSDVMPVDVDLLVEDLNDATMFPTERDAISIVASQFAAQRAAGKILVRAAPFWTTANAFWEIRADGSGGGAAVWADVHDSTLVVFKGDLNYRKLVYDGAWARTTPFATALGPLATAGVTVLSLRTVKADVIVGLGEGVGEALDAQSNRWMWGGKYGVVSYNC